MANGLDPNDNGRTNPANGAYGDLDGDGLTNAEEYIHGTAANNADTDGDGVSDGDEVKLLESQALVGDVAPFQNVQTLNGSAFVNSLGTWQTDGKGSYCTSTRGWVEYTVNAPQAGIYLLDLDHSAYSGGSLSDQYEVVFSVNGQQLERVTTTIAEGETGNAKALTPWIPAGENTIRVFVDNSLTWRRVKLGSLSVLSAQGGDSNANGTPDWVESRLAKLNTIDTTILQSKVSPAMLEGAARHFDSINAGGQILRRAPGDRWFTDVYLDADSATTQRITFENGGLTIERDISWVPTNLLEETVITVRQGDSLLLTAFNGTEATDSSELVDITINGQSHSTTADVPVEQRFDTAGQTVITVEHTHAGLTINRTVTVKVLPSTDLYDATLVQGYYREWEVPALPAGAVLELDERIEVREIIDLAAGAKRYIVKTDATEDLHGIIRDTITEQILGSVTFNHMRVRDSGDTAVYYVEALENGSYVTEMPVIVDGMVDDVTLRYDIFIGGVTFEGGGITKDYTHTDFDEIGQTKVRLVKTGTNGSICHRGSVWQDGKRLAWFY